MGCPMLAPIAHVLELLSHFKRRTDGSIAPIAALTLIPIMTAVGAAVDYSRANNFRSGIDRKSTRLNSSHIQKSRMPSSA